LPSAQSSDHGCDGDEPFGEVQKNALEKAGEEKLAREAERPFEYLREEESKQKKAHTSESGGHRETGASSSGPVASEEEVQRSLGGVPMAADSGDCIPEMATRKIGDSMLGESEQHIEKKNETGNEEKEGVKRSIGECEEFAKRTSIRADARADQGRRKSRGEREPRRTCGRQPLCWCKRSEQRACV
jgi:hypothetical protein